MIAQVQIRPRPVFCVTERAYRNRALAEEVCAGLFTHAGITLEIGTEPDWLTAELPGDEEWRIEWTKFYYGLDLASAFGETGDAKFLRTWERLVRSWIDQVPVGFDSSDVAGRRIQNWIYAWNAFASAPGFTGLAEGLDEQIVRSLTLHVDHLRHHLTPERNHRTLELYALFIAALALPEVDADGTLLDFAVSELHRNLLADVRPDGVHREHSTHYHMTTLRSFLGARENAHRFGLTLRDGYDERLERACEFALHCHRPDGLIPALSDSDTGSYLDLLDLAAALCSRPDFLYAATAGTQGAPPRRRSASFPDGGYFTQRSGWGEGGSSFREERFLIFDCGPLGDGGHGHYDLLNVEIAARGRPLVVDPGRYTYSEQPPNWRRWFKGTAAHNTVCVDGLDQTPYSCGKPKREVAQGRLVERLSAPGFDVLGGEATSPAYEAVHTRRIFFIAGEYWILWDRLRGERPHHFALRFHLAPEAWGRTTITAHEHNTAVRAPGVALVFDAAHRPVVEPGWVAPKYGIKVPAPVVNVSADGVAAADFFTLLVPLGPNEPLPGFHLTPVEACSPQAIAVQIGGVGPHRTATDTVVWNAQPEHFPLGPFECHAAAAWLRTTANGESSSLRACQVQELTLTSGARAKLFASARPSQWVMWDELRGVAQDDGRGL